MTKAIGPRNISSLLGSVKTLKTLAKAAAAVDTHEPEQLKPLRLSFPPALAEHAQALQDGHVLVLIAANNTVAQVLRFHAPRLMKQAGLNEWYVKVARISSQPITQKSQRPGATLTSEAADTLRETAKNIDHEGLQQAMLRLASRAEEN
ncbi:MAG TPA: hypothetical protein VK099_02390 [Alcanivoracaceae bacterium]|nr:hypothetical protein [Alcanivoracaceae bacterium]